MKVKWWCALDTDEHGNLQPEQVTVEQVTIRPLNPARGGVPRLVSPQDLSDTPQGALDAAVERAQQDLVRAEERVERARRELEGAVKVRDLLRWPRRQAQE